MPLWLLAVSKGTSGGEFRPQVAAAASGRERRRPLLPLSDRADPKRHSAAQFPDGDRAAAGRRAAPLLLVAQSGSVICRVPAGFGRLPARGRF